jgi:hypothetical protein
MPNAGEASPALVTPLRLRGYAVIPAPREVELADATLAVDAAWQVSLDGVAKDDPAVASLVAGVAQEYGWKWTVKARAAGVAPRTITLAIRAGAVRTGAEAAIDRQAYRLEIGPDGVRVTGNAAPGLFYGVQTLLLLLDGDGRTRGVLPRGTIADWPRYALRIVHWDTKHHQDRLETLRRYLDQLGRLKINAVSFELEDKFAWPSHPVIGAPTAFTTEELAGLTRYAQARHIQIIPNIQAPAHFCWALKHPEFAHLRCDGSNYMACMDDHEARRLIFDLYDDAIAATPGVEYLHVSTDEVYYAGICERFRRPYDPVNRSLTWVDFVNAAHAHLARRGRKTIVWAEFPLLAEHIALLPPDLIDGIGGNAAYLPEEAKRGIRQFVYVPIQGEEPLFPNYFAAGEGDDDWRGRPRLDELYETCLRGPAATGGNPLGAFAAGWDDSGLHNETFWLGWTAMAQNAWTPGTASIAQTTAEFMESHYGREAAAGMAQAYRDLQDQARFWTASWQRRPSRERPPAYGSSGGKRPVARTDRLLDPPDVPALPDLLVRPAFAQQNGAALAELPARLAQSDRLQATLHAALGRASRNRHGIEVLLSLAALIRHHLRLLRALAEAENEMVEAGRDQAAGRRDEALRRLRRAAALADETVAERREVFCRLQAVWEKSRLPRNADANGRTFLHVLDDVKDHVADRRRDLSYLIAPEERIGVEAWRAKLQAVVDASVR